MVALHRARSFLAAFALQLEAGRGRGVPIWHEEVGPARTCCLRMILGQKSTLVSPSVWLGTSSCLRSRGSLASFPPSNHQFLSIYASPSILQLPTYRSHLSSEACAEKSHDDADQGVPVSGGAARQSK
ncbi:hypothetical protein BKA81DRAFT_352045 [Phyllosticta paracitricarpa]